MAALRLMCCYGSSWEWWSGPSGPDVCDSPPSSCTTIPGST